MKTPRVVTLLFVSLLAVPLFAASAPTPQSLGSKARCVSLEHTRGAWWMQIECAGQAGTIVMIDSAAESYRGEGMFASWTQDDLRAAYRSLLPKDDGVRLELLQLG